MSDDRGVWASRPHNSPSCGGEMHVDVNYPDGSKDHVPLSDSRFLGAWAIGAAQSDEMRDSRR